MNTSMPRLVRITTVPESLQFLLTGQLTAMQKTGMDVMAISSPGPFLKELARDGVRTYSITMPRHVSPLCDLRAVFTLIRVLRAERPDIVHSHTPKAGLLGMLAAWCAGVAIRIHTYAGAPYDGASGLAVTLVKLADRLTALCATDVWSVGDDLVAFLEAEGIVRRGRLKVLGAGSSNGIELSEFFPTQCDQPQHPPRFIWIGRLAADKGLAELADMWCEIAALAPQARLELVGDLDERDPVSAPVLARLRQAPGVHFVGFRPDVAERLRAADLLLFTSRREGLPGVILQAQACGIPVVTLRCRGVEDALIDGVGGRIFERTAWREAAHTAVDIAYNPTLWRNYRVAGCHFIREYFDRKIFHKKLARRYKALLRRCRYNRASHRGFLRGVGRPHAPHGLH